MNKFKIIVTCNTCGKQEILVRRIPVPIESILPGWVTLYEIESTPNPLKIGEDIRLPIYYCPDCIKNL